MTVLDAAPWEAAARLWEPKPRRWATPGELACELDPRMVQTPALELVDQALVDLADGRDKRLAIFMSPQEGKSERASHYFPLWLLANDPDTRVAIISYSGDIARRWGWLLRQDIETFDGSEGRIDLGLKLGVRPPAGRFQVEGRRGGVYCVGIAGSLTGRAVDLLVIDDPIKDLEQAQSDRYRERAWLFWTAVAVPRMGPHTRTVLIQCMTGDTPVLMGDGAERPLRDVRPGDTVATYEDGAFTTSTVRNWANRGPDFIFKVTLQSGRVVRANARHPFLTVDEDGVEKWRRTDELRPGSVIQTATGASGEASPARTTDATSPPSAMSSVPPLPTWKLEPDEVVEVAPCGVEDVFDLQIDRTENFVANGLISHNTRWHEDDLAGRLLQSEGTKDKGGRWRVISIPAQCEDRATDQLDREEGEYMISARGRTAQDWQERRKDVGEYVWAALFQQRPAPAEGGLFKRLWWRYWTRAGNHLYLGGRTADLRDSWRFGTVDLAASTRTSADYTVIAAWARTPAGDLVLLDVVRVRIGEDQHFAQARPLVERWQLDTLFVEAGQYGYTLVREATQHGVPVTPVQAEQDKFTRALPYSAWCSSGRVWLPAEAPWSKVWIDEHAGFPAASHDDMVDVGSMATRVAVTRWVPLASRAGHTTVGQRVEPEPDPFGGQRDVDLETVAF